MDFENKRTTNDSVHCSFDLLEILPNEAASPGPIDLSKHWRPAIIGVRALFIFGVVFSTLLMVEPSIAPLKRIDLAILAMLITNCALYVMVLASSGGFSKLESA